MSCVSIAARKQRAEGGIRMAGMGFLDGTGFDMRRLGGVPPGMVVLGLVLKSFSAVARTEPQCLIFAVRCIKRQVSSHRGWQNQGPVAEVGRVNSKLNGARPAMDDSLRGIWPVRP